MDSNGNSTTKLESVQTLFGKYSPEKAKSINNSAMIVSALATVGAWAWCFNNKKGVLAYIGYGLAAGMAGTLLAGAGAAVIVSDKK